MKFMMKMAALSLVFAGFGSAYAANAQCDQLQKQKALIYAAHGYCFKDADAKKKYGNDDCHTKKPKFSGAEADRLAQIETKQKELNCPKKDL